MRESDKVGEKDSEWRGTANGWGEKERGWQERGKMKREREREREREIER